MQYKVNKVFLFILAIFFLLFTISCNKVPAGNVGIKFYLLGGDKGISHEELSPGRYWIGWNEELYLFPTYRQTKTWTNDAREDTKKGEGFEFQSKEGLKLTANVGIEYHIESNNVGQVFEMYKRGVQQITDKVLRNAVRHAFITQSSTRTTAEMYGLGKINFLVSIKNQVIEEAAKKFITVVDIYLIGNMGIPHSVTDALNRKIEATQKAEQRENELRQTEAEAQKLIAKSEGEAQALLIEAKSIAKANHIINNSLTPLLLQNQALKKWNGTLPKVTGTSGIPLIDLK